jgi:hypothetical protein
MLEGGQEQPRHSCHRRLHHGVLNLRDVFHERAPKPREETFALPVPAIEQKKTSGLRLKFCSPDFR